MLFTIKNLGRLEEAEIDLGKDILLLTGPNNTSKTYVAYSIYGFTHELRKILFEDVLPRYIPSWESFKGGLDLLELLTRNERDFLAAVVKGYTSRLPAMFAAPPAFSEKVTVHVDRLLQEAARRMSIFGRKGGVRLSSDDFEAICDDSLRIEVTARNGGSLTSVLGWLSDLLESFLLPDMRSSHILTSERGAIQLFSREIAQNRLSLVDQINMQMNPVEHVRRRAGRYSLPIQTSLRRALELHAWRTSQSTLGSFADALEKDVLGGRVTVAADGDLLFHPFESEESLGLGMSSSTVKALAFFVTYLRHLAEAGDFLIIDEPELNLHPDNQRRVARLLARLSRAGIKVMMSTHSDYVIRELNNLIMLNADATGELRRKHGYEEGEVLDPARVGAYLFDAKRANRIEVGEMGIAVETIDREINKLNTVSQDLFYSLFAYKG